jgi:hypothetical protein
VISHLICQYFLINYFSYFHLIFTSLDSVVVPTLQEELRVTRCCVFEQKHIWTHNSFHVCHLRKCLRHHSSGLILTSLSLGVQVPSSPCISVVAHPPHSTVKLSRCQRFSHFLKVDMPSEYEAEKKARVVPCFIHIDKSCLYKM